MNDNRTGGNKMNHLRVIIYMCILGILIYPQISFAETDEEIPLLINNGKCPKSQNLEIVSSDKGLINALNTIIPEVYKNQNYKGWKVETIAHLPKSPRTEDYYAMAKNYCGEEIANNSWFVEVLFPEYLPAYDASHRQIFVTKNKQGQWFLHGLDFINAFSTIGRDC